MTNKLMKEIEVEVAQSFLDIFNTRTGCAFEILHTGESPDIYCLDKMSGEKLSIEITMHENLEGDIKKKFEMIKDKRSTMGNSLGMRGCMENILQNLRKLLDKKLQATYSNTHTALVIGRVTTLWSCNEWRIMAAEFAREVFQGKENSYPKGVWIFCTDDETTSSDILNLLEIKNPG